MTVELLQSLSLMSFILCGVFLLTAIILFFVLKVPGLIGDISGANARKAIENIRRQNESSGDKAYKPSAVNVQRGQLTDKISASGRLEHRTGKLGGGVGTEKLNTQLLLQEAARSAASGSHETTLLNNKENMTILLDTDGNETTRLDVGSETTLLSQENTTDAFCIDVEFGFCESAEIIE